MTQPRDDWERKFTKADRLSKEQIRQLREAFDRGVSYRDAAREMGCSSRTTCRRYAQFRGKPHQKPQYIPKVRATPIPQEPPKPASRFYKGSFDL